MASEIEVVDDQRELQSGAVTQVEDSAAGSLVPSDTIEENVRQGPVGPPQPRIKDSQQLVLIIILLGTAYLTLHRIQHMNASVQDTLNEGLLELQLGQEALRYSSENSRITMQIFLEQRQEVIDELMGRRAENTGKISALISGPRALL